MALNNLSHQRVTSPLFYFTGDPSLTADGLTIYFSSNRGGSFDLYRATRPSLDAPFAMPAAVPVLNADAHNELSPEISSDGKFIHFASNRNGVLEIYS